MRSFLFQNGDQSITQMNDIQYEIQKLNKLVINYCVQSISSQLSMYDKYMYDLENLAVPEERPKYVEQTKQTLGHPYL